MNEIEARGKIKYRIANEMGKYGENKEEYEDLEIALQVMKEIREYRELGTVEDIQLIFSLCKDLERIVKKYEAIGTMEELQALKEKNEPKKVVVEHVPKTSWTREVSHYLCPSCRNIVSFNQNYCE